MERCLHSHSHNQSVSWYSRPASSILSTSQSVDSTTRPTFTTRSVHHIDHEWPPTHGDSTRTHQPTKKICRVSALTQNKKQGRKSFFILVRCKHCHLGNNSFLVIIYTNTLESSLFINNLCYSFSSYKLAFEYHNAVIYLTLKFD